MSDLQESLSEIQKNLKAPKGQRNNFGKYNYRSCEDILEAVKPLLGEMILTISDEIVHLGDRFYVKATVRLKCGLESLDVTGLARESDIKKGMDSAQITGSASSYARKYALNGLFCIDDTKDADTQSPADNERQTPAKTAPPKPQYSECQTRLIDAIKKNKIDGKSWMSEEGLTDFGKLSDNACVDYLTKIDNGDYAK